MVQTAEEIIEPIKSELEDAESGFVPNQYEIAVYPADFTLQGYYDKWNQGTIRLPDFQRQYVWPISRASRLIESFLLGLPVPGIFLYKEHSTQHFLVVDGHQRLLSVFFFFKGLFKNERAFRLTGLESRWKGLTFEELDEPDKLKLQDSVLRATIINQLHPDNDTSIHHIFDRLNTTSTPLSNQEIRHCLSWGLFNDLIRDLNQNSTDWRKILGKVQPDERQRDNELILRFFALLEPGQRYSKPMRDFLNKYMKKRRNPSEDELLRLREVFNDTAHAVVGHLGAKPFHVRGAGLNAAVFDSVFVAIARHLDSLPHDLYDRYSRLKKHPQYELVTTSATTDETVVSKRLEEAESVLFGN